jgi:hypothetical protein
MLLLGQSEAMSPATIPTTPPVVPTAEATTKATVPTDHVTPQAAFNGAANSREAESSHEERARRSNAARDLSPVSDEVIDNLVVRVAASDEAEAVSELATRSGAPRPAGALMVAAIDGRLLAAVSMSNGETVREPTPLGIAAAAVVRYRVARLAGPRGTSQKAAVAA